MIVRCRNKSGIRSRLAVLSVTVACIAGVCAPTASALTLQPLPPGHSTPTHSTPPDPCSVAASGRC
jgi:hypothetical protein